MKPTKTNFQKEELRNFLQKIVPETKYFIKQDEILGKTFAIVEETEGGSYSQKSSYMSYNEMDAFLWGILFFKNETKN